MSTDLRPFPDLSCYIHPRCHRLCCPVAVVHDRTHPGCSASPLLWDGDQA